MWSEATTFATIFYWISILIMQRDIKNNNQKNWLAQNRAQRWINYFSTKLNCSKVTQSCIYRYTVECRALVKLLKKMVTDQAGLPAPSWSDQLILKLLIIGQSCPPSVARVASSIYWFSRRLQEFLQMVVFLFLTTFQSESSNQNVKQWRHVAIVPVSLFKYSTILYPTFLQFSFENGHTVIKEYATDVENVYITVCICTPMNIY